MKPLTTEQFEYILSFLSCKDWDEVQDHVIEEFTNKFKPDPSGEIKVDIDVSEDIGLLTMRDRDMFGVSYIEVTNKSVKRIDPRDIKIKR